MGNETFKIDQIVLVTELSNYKASYAEETPFKAKVTYIVTYPPHDDDDVYYYDVVSLVTGKQYELYPFQLEGIKSEQ